MTEEKKEYIRENGFIVIGLTYLFELMEKISIFYFIRWIGKRIGDNADVFLRNGIFSEIWVLGNLVFAIIAQNVVQSTDIMIIPELSEPPVRTLGATIPENESHIFR